MVEFGDLMSRIDISQASLSALVWVLVLGAGLFIWKKAWPWFVAEYFPARQKRLIAQTESANALEKEKVNVLTTMRDALIELKVISGQQLLLLQTHDTESRRVSAVLLEQQRDALAAMAKMGPAVLAGQSTMVAVAASGTIVADEIGKASDASRA